jgi:hypothetical protein
MGKQLQVSEVLIHIPEEVEGKKRRSVSKCLTSKWKNICDTETKVCPKDLRGFEIKV